MTLRLLRYVTLVGLTIASIPAASETEKSARPAAQTPSYAEAKHAALLEDVGRLTAVIDSGRVQGGELAELYRYRGISFSRLNENDHALRDLGQAIQLDGFNPEYYEDRAITYLKLRDFGSAQTDLAMALGLDSKRPTANREEGRLASYQGEHGRAARSFARAMDNDEGIGVVYAAIWLHIAAVRGGFEAASPLQALESVMSADQWPAPVIRMFNGAIPPEAAIAAARSSDPAIDEAQKCEAYFYAGERYLVEEKPEAAKAAFEAAVATGVTEFLEYDWALRELELMESDRRNSRTGSSAIR